MSEGKIVVVNTQNTSQEEAAIVNSLAVINEVKKIQTYESWKKENMKQLMRDFINEYEDLFDSVCKAKYKSRKGVNSEKSN